MLQAIRNNWQKSKAAVIIQTGIENAPLGNAIPIGPAKMANALVERLWLIAPQFVDGSQGPRPNPPSVAVLALTLATEGNEGISSVERQILQFVLVGLIEELTVNRFKYSLNGTDEYLIAMSQQSLAEQFEKLATDETRTSTNRPEQTEPLHAELQAHSSDLATRIKAAQERRR